MKDYSELVRLAEAATPGPWKQHLVDDTTVICSHGDVCCTFANGGGDDDVDFDTDTERCEANAAFIAAANPQTILALTARVKELEEENKGLQEHLTRACALHIDFDCARYIIASSREMGSGSEKAQRHRQICQFLTAVFARKSDPDLVDVRHPFYVTLHDESQKFTGNLSGKLHDAQDRRLAHQFADLALEISSRAISGKGV